MPGEGLGSGRKVGRGPNPHVCKGHTGYMHNDSLPAVSKTKSAAVGPHRGRGGRGSRAWGEPERVR